MRFIVDITSREDSGLASGQNVQRPTKDRALRYVIVSIHAPRVEEMELTGFSITGISSRVWLEVFLVSFTRPSG